MHDILENMYKELHQIISPHSCDNLQRGVQPGTTWNCILNIESRLKGLKTTPNCGKVQFITLEISATKKLAGAQNLSLWRCWPPLRLLWTRWAGIGRLLGVLFCSIPMTCFEISTQQTAERYGASKLQNTVLISAIKKYCNWHGRWRPSHISWGLLGGTPIFDTLHSFVSLKIHSG